MITVYLTPCDAIALCIMNEVFMKYAAENMCEMPTEYSQGARITNEVYAQIQSQIKEEDVITYQATRGDTL